MEKQEAMYGVLNRGDRRYNLPSLSAPVANDSVAQIQERDSALQCVSAKAKREVSASLGATPAKRALLAIEDSGKETVSEYKMADTVEGITLKTRHRNVIITLSFSIAVLTIGHEMWLFAMHYQVLLDLGQGSQLAKAVLHGIPSYLPVVTFPCSVLVMLCCMVVSQVADGWAGLILGIHTFISILLTALYPAQIIVYLWADTHIYLTSYRHYTRDMLPKCVCSPLDMKSTALKEAYRCLCSAVDGASRMFYFENRPAGNKTWYDLVASMDEGVRGSTIVYTNTSLPEDPVPPQSYDSLKVMFLGLQASVLVMVLRMPLFLLWNDVEFTQDSEEARDNLHKRLRGKKTPVVGVESPRQPEEEDSNQKKESYIQRKMQARFMMNLACYGFVDGADAFSLIQLFEDHPEFYATHTSVTNVILMVISLMLLAINWSNFIVVLPHTPRGYRRCWRLMVALVGNLPSLIVRSCMLFTHGGLDSISFSYIYVLFIMKELTIITLGFGEYVMDECITQVLSKKMAAAAPKREDRPKDLLGMGLNFTSTSLQSNQASKYRVKLEEHIKQQSLANQNWPNNSMPNESRPKKSKSNDHWPDKSRPKKYWPDESMPKEHWPDELRQSGTPKDNFMEGNQTIASIILGDTSRDSKE